MRRVVLATLASLLGTTAAFASFDLALIFAGGAVHRYDPVNNVALGSFGQGRFGNAATTTLEWSPQRPTEVIALGSDGGIRRLNFSTGEFLGGFQMAGVNTLFANGPQQVKLLANGNYLVNANFGGGVDQQSRIYSPTGTLITTMNPLGIAYQPLSSVQAADGRIFTLTRRFVNGNNYEFGISTFSSTGAYQGIISQGTGLVDAVESLAITSNRLVAIAGRSSTAPNPLVMNYNPVNIGTFANGGFVSQSGWSNAVTGHANEVQWMQSNGGVNRWYRMDPITNGYGNIHTMPQTFNATSIALVVAPEPGTLMALGAGVAFFVRKRKKG